MRWTFGVVERCCELLRPDAGGSLEQRRAQGRITASVAVYGIASVGTLPIYHPQHVNLLEIDMSSPVDGIVICAQDLYAGFCFKLFSL